MIVHVFGERYECRVELIVSSLKLVRIRWKISVCQRSIVSREFHRWKRFYDWPEHHRNESFRNIRKSVSIENERNSSLFELVHRRQTDILLVNDQIYFVSSRRDASKEIVSIHPTRVWNSWWDFPLIQMWFVSVFVPVALIFSSNVFILTNEFHVETKILIKWCLLVLIDSQCVYKSNRNEKIVNREFCKTDSKKTFVRMNWNTFEFCFAVRFIV